MEIFEYIFDQVLEEGPQIMGDTHEQSVQLRQCYVEEIMNSWSNVELLQRINDALTRSE